VKSIKNYWEFNKLFVVFTFLWTCTILYLSLSSFESVQISINVSSFDKLAHFLMYAFYAFLIVFSFKNVARKKLRFYFLIFLYLFFFGYLIEILQGSITNSRSQDIKDALANGFGSFVGLLFSYAVNKCNKKNNKIII